MTDFNTAIRIAADLIGEDALDSEYARGIIEFICDTTPGLDTDSKDDVQTLIGAQIALFNSERRVQSLTDRLFQLREDNDND